MDRSCDSRGQLLPAVLILLIILSLFVPLMVLFTQNESRWTAKQGRSTTAFHLAEAGTEKGYLILTQSTGTWVNLQAGIPIPGFQYDVSYADLNGGYYTVSITSGPLAQQATIVSVGTDRNTKETRAIQVVYSNVPLGGVAVYGGGGADVSGSNITVEWGAIMSPNNITMNSDQHPSVWSAGNISLDANGATPPNCDSPNCWWWHSYFANIPPAPVIDFNFYQTSATNAGIGPCGAYYVNGNKSGTCNDTSGHTYYVTGNWTNFDGPVIGTVIVLGSLTTPNGAMNGLAQSAVMPQDAWKQYCNDWAYYRATYEPTNPYVAQCPGLYSSYLSPVNTSFAISPVVTGMLYVGGDFTGPNGGGNTDLVYGVIFVKGVVNLNSGSHVKVYYSKAASSAMQTTQLSLTRTSWRDVLVGWPTGLAYF